MEAGFLLFCFLGFLKNFFSNDGSLNAVSPNTICQGLAFSLCPRQCEAASPEELPSTHANPRKEVLRADDS